MHRSLPSGTFLVTLADHANRDGVCYPSYTRVGGSLRFSAEAVEALLKRGSKQ